MTLIVQNYTGPLIFFRFFRGTIVILFKQCYNFFVNIMGVNILSHKKMVYIRGIATASGFFNTIKASNIATELHKDQTRLNGEPYINHPTEVTLLLIDLGILDDITLATAMLHDTIEDCGITKEQLIDKYGISPEIPNNVELLSKYDGLSLDQYFEQIKSNPVCTLVKITDRCHNISTMIDGFSAEKMEEYIIETEKYIFPLCEHARYSFPEYSNQVAVMKSMIESNLKLAKAFLKIYKELYQIYKEKTQKSFSFLKKRKGS